MFSASVDIRKALAKFDAVERKQVPFAMSLALNAVAHAVVEDMEPEAKRVFDRPTRFTAKAFRFERATKRRLVAVVRRKTAQSRRRYLEVQSQGGARSQTGMERRLSVEGGLRTLVPTSSARKTAAGNWAPSQRKAALAARRGDGGKFFKAGRRSHLSPGIYERRGKKQKLVKLAQLTSVAPKYDKRLDVRGVAVRRVGRSFRREFRSAMARAKATAR